MKLSLFISAEFIVLRFKRLLDLSFSLFLLLLLSPLLLALALLVKATSNGPVLFWSHRVGRKNQMFWMPKFRSMRIDTPQVATHLLSDPGAYLTPAGIFLRTSSLDELPQLWSIFRGDLSFVGPRPALFNQEDLVDMRTALNIHTLTPGLTGWAQVNGRDDLSIPVKVRFDREYLERQSLLFDLTILRLTAAQIVRSKGVHH